MLIPIKAFGAAKKRLAAVLTPDERSRLAKAMAERVIAAGQSATVFVVCDDQSVADWAVQRNASVLWHPSLGLNAAVSAAVGDIRGSGFDHVVIAHSDLPLARSLIHLATHRQITLVPDARLDGTNVLSMPTDAPLTMMYGSGSYRRHLQQALVTNLQVQVVHDLYLSRDVDTPRDLAHPLLLPFSTEVLHP